MVQHKNQTLIRIVSVDHYMSKPDPQFDTCYSEFRGAEVKQVPVIRLFGSNAEGTHSCVHIHGVFPYFYVPYDGSVADRLAVDKKIYQLAGALDKGINVMLGRASSQAKHIFKIVLVKGIPIYGYHRNPHHYFKIYMYNPYLVRNATQLLMNGTILSGSYQVHETHIPYILQFFIDYNLYGMSFLELDSKGLRQRTGDVEGDRNIPPKMTTSEYEIDALASEILNREPDGKEDGEFANPGIASIWKDEQARRALLGLEQPERMYLSQGCGPPVEVVTESDRFYRARLLAQLLKEPTPSSSAEDQAKVSSSAYPSEASEGEALLDASYIAIHARASGVQSNESLYDSQISYHFDASSVVDEGKIISMSQNLDVTLDEEDYNLLEIMRELEENESKNIEGDCLLAPLTQQSGESNRSIIQATLNLSQANKILNASMCGDLETVCLMSGQANRSAVLNQDQDASFDSDDEFLLDLTQKQAFAGNDTAPEAEPYFSDSDEDLLAGGRIPQLDGGDDSFTPNTPKRNRDSKEGKSLANSSAKKMRIDLTQPIARKSLTPRRVRFALSPKEKDEERANRVLKEFEDSSPNTLKNFEIRIPKLGLIKKSILFHNRKSPKSNDEATAPLKNLHVRVQKLDPTAYDVHKPSVPKPDDRYQLARTYDLLNNYDPLEGPSTPKSERCRRKSTDDKGQPKSKQLKLDVEQQIEVILSERFKNIVRLSPKVLIKPLLLMDKPAVNSELSLSEYSSPRKTPPEAGVEQTGDFSDNVTTSVSKSPECSSLVSTVNDKTTDTVPSSDAMATPPEVSKVLESNSTNEPTNQCSAETATNECVAMVETDEATKDSDTMDVEFSLPTSSDEVSGDKEMERIDDDASDIPASSLPDEASHENTVPDKHNGVTITIDDNSDISLNSESASKPPKEKSIESEPIISIPDDEEDDFRMITPSLLDAIPLSDLFQKDATAAKETINISDDDSDKQSTAPAVTIESQLDGVVELMDEVEDAVGEKQTHDTAAATNAEAVEDEEEDNANIQSFCEKTLLCELDEINSDSDDSCVGAWNKDSTEKEENEQPVVVSLAAGAPTRAEAQQAIDKFEIPAVINPTPFYSDPADVTGKKEVGHTVLHVGGNSLNDVEEFTSTIAGLGSLKHLRYDNLQRTFGENINDVLGPVGANGPSSDRMKELLASEGSVAITPSQLPPSRTEASEWIDNRCRKRSVDAAAAAATKEGPADSDSPIKVKTVDTLMTVDDGATPARLPAPKIDSESSLNLSVLVANDGNAAPSASSTDKTNATMQERTKPSQDCDVIESSMMESTEAAPNAATNEEQAEKNADMAAEETIAPVSSIASSNQSDLEQSNANISSATPSDNTFGFKVDYENLQDAKSKCEYNYLTVMSVEIHVNTRGDLRPNPATDPIAAIFYRIHNDVPPNHPRASSVCGIILNRDHEGREFERVQGQDGGKTASFKYNQCPYVADVVLVSDESELYEKFLLLISFWDPDIFTGYEIESVSWGYVIERGYALEMNLMKRLSRVPSAETVHVSEEEQRELLEMHDYSAGLKIPGRILLDIWRLMRHEIALTSYTFENVVYHILHRRVPNHSYRQLSRLWSKPYSRWIVLEYYLERVNGNFEILNQLDLIGRTAELAKLFGIQFYEVLSRGSQFRVESMMMRIAKPRNFVSVSPSINQRAHMRAPEYLPLILEPNSRFYADPIIVLDFQSLYPSVIIAYNYCFSTCLGRIEHLGKDTESFEFGASRLRVPPKMLKALLDKNLVTFSPCGVAFVKKRVREGVLPRMLSEILNTRLMVKKSMKLHKDNSVLQRVLHSRQLGLKLIANVTYGYTAANFSGRMPCVEIGDSVVAKGRETLERAIKLVEGTERWGAKVVYGDTDSLFVLCPGRSREAAFKIGEEIAEAVTNANPPPVKLKLEKVYQPAILQTKKRYVGYMYESADQEKPIYEAKGIETVRRDGCPVVAKMLEKVLRILFETCDVSKVKQYTCRQFTKILEGRVNLQDFIFAKEFRGESGYKPGACVPALELMRKWKLTDPRREPRQGQRVPYVIINGPPLVPLIRLVRSPEELLSNEGLKINANYYISKAIIPPLNRCLLLIGADAHQWYSELPRKTLMLHNTGGGGGGGGSGGAPVVKMGAALATTGGDERLHKKITISQYFSTTNCIVDCGKQTHHGVCKDCRQQPQRALVHVMNKVNKLERKLVLTEKMCRSCCQRTFETACISLDCPVVFSLNRRELEHKQAQYYRDLIEELF
ncbi:DNA polymerase zeta catalytic subunit [Anopheles arabiensis]|uniref:DNA polymerase zeta catalytic subunit n=1 Tax=Anopheles arabiensis TaxID=7173 RepID=A0A182HK90_ANOAR|nr:DNA polymerase zeta catalytic subunit [Anopheles arabiensis]